MERSLHSGCKTKLTNNPLPQKGINLLKIYIKTQEIFVILNLRSFGNIEKYEFYRPITPNIYVKARTIK